MGHHSFFTQAPVQDSARADPQPWRDFNNRIRVGHELPDNLTHNNSDVDLEEQRMASSEDQASADDFMAQLQNAVKSPVPDASASRMSYAAGALTPTNQQSLSASQSLRQRRSVYSRPSSSGSIGHQPFFTRAPAQAQNGGHTFPFRNVSDIPEIKPVIHEQAGGHNEGLPRIDRPCDESARDGEMEEYNYVWTGM